VRNSWQVGPSRMKERERERVTKRAELADARGQHASTLAGYGWAKIIFCTC